MWSYRLVAPYQLEETTAVKPRAAALGPGQVLLRSLAGGICGSDLPYFRGEPPLVPIPGLNPRLGLRPDGFPMHELVGEVVTSNDESIAVGTIVAGWASSMSGLAEFVVASGAMVAEVPGELTPAHAVMVQPLACVIEAVSRLGDVAGRRAAVVGLGPIGLLFAHVLASGGATPVCGVDQIDRSSCASLYGLNETIHDSAAAWVARLEASTVRPELVIEAVGHQVGTLGAAIEAAAPGGTVLYFGIPDDPVYPLPMSTFVRKGLTLIAGTTRERRGALISATTYLSEHPALPARYVTDVFPRLQVNEAYLAATRPRADQLKVVVDFA